MAASRNGRTVHTGTLEFVSAQLSKSARSEGTLTEVSRYCSGRIGRYPLDLLQCVHKFLILSEEVELLLVVMTGGGEHPAWDP
eukprot:209473-Amphidinium_carterae.2